MKLETALRAPFAGRVREVLVAANTQVEGGTKLVRLEPADGASAAAAGGRARRPGGAAHRPRSPPRAPAAAAAADALTALRYLVLGYDLDEADARALLPRAVGGPRRAARRRPGRAGRRARHHADLRRPVGAVAQPARPGDLRRRAALRRRPGGRLRRDGAQPAGVPLRLPALPRRRRRGPARVVPGPAARRAGALRRRRPASDRAGRRGAGHARSTGCSSPTAGPAAHVPGGAGPAAVAARARRGLAALPPAAREEYLRTPRPPGHRHPGAAPGRRRPGPAGALPLLRRAADRRRARPRPGAGARRAGPAATAADPADPGRADRRRSSPPASRSWRCSASGTTPRCSR